MGNKVGIWINHSKITKESITPQLINWFNSQGWETVPEWDQEITEDVDFVLSLGGDGTVLKAAREAARFNIPVLGVNYGRLGFLCEVERGEIYSALKKVLRNEYTVDERLMMITSYFKDGQKQQDMVLNDVVFIRDSEETLITLQVKLSGEPIASPPSDGLIIATPTGSTAYSLSAGGPVVSPDVQAMLVTPLAAHALSSRPMVVSNKEKIDISLTRGNKCRVTVDGKYLTTMNSGDTVRIETAPIKARFIRLGGRSFPKVVREKLRDRWHES
ncbi:MULTISPECIES: NAD(+)/NADH kinase [unclassified Dehalobacter]|uniref:NAD(+)/NADH kinase n=1 Tax=unclassified Dehalobacter TaxID=2635733 RepID=UPI000E6C6BD2|nr:MULTISPECIES: NAD(+)/NADH kinase [unclassified Dehalobacter]RJE48398.1 NAD+ kinase [Dehalobacter sp. MCB1]TCX50467.1 NAD+ kinase [Dehalobacter sp. 14DCB1]TCX52293.1 NAD+ kinase [Dehalobacter sp. 12DCB1]